jgi:hypothetical protein
LSSSPETDFRVAALAEATADANQLDEELRIQVARIVVELHRNPYLGELMGDRPPRILQGARKIRFDRPGWKGKPRYRLVYRNEPVDGAAGESLIIAIGRRDRMIAYAKAARRVKEQAIERGHSG